LTYESFNGYITTRGFNLGKILRNRELNSDLNMSAKFSGNGFTNLYVNANYSLSGSSIAGFRINRSSGNIKTNGKTLILNTNTSSSTGNAVVNGRINISQNPTYVLKGKVAGLDISQITKDPENKSSLNMSFNINGRGTDLNSINGKYDFIVDESTFNGETIPAMPINVEIKSGGNSSVLIVTDMAELNATGKFDIASLNNGVQSTIKAFIDVINSKFNINPENEKNTASSNIVTRDLNVDYSLVIKDSAKFNKVLQPFGINFNGDVKGNILNNSSGFNIQMVMNVYNFEYQDSVIQLKNLSTDLKFQNNYSDNSITSFSPYTIILNAKGDRILYGST